MIELLANALDIAVLTILFCKRFLPKYNSVFPTIGFVIVGFLLESVPLVFEGLFYPTEVILYALCIIF